MAQRKQSNGSRLTLTPHNDLVPTHISPGLEREWFSQRIVVFRLAEMTQEIATAWYDCIVNSGVHEAIKGDPWFDIYHFLDSKHLMKFPDYMRENATNLLGLGDLKLGVTAVVVGRPLAAQAMNHYFMRVSQCRRPRRFFTDFDTAFAWVENACQRQYKYLERYGSNGKQANT